MRSVGVRGLFAALATSAILVLALTGCTPTSAKTVPGGGSVAHRETAVPAPGDGTIQQTVAPQPAGAVTKVGFAEAAVLPNRVTISLLKVVRQKVAATSPGEIAGPAIIATVSITNNGSTALDLGSTVVALLDSEGNPGQSTTAGPADSFTHIADPGVTQQGVYVFGVPATGVNPITISVSCAGGAPVAVFAGSVS